MDKGVTWVLNSFSSCFAGAVSGLSSLKTYLPAAVSEDVLLGERKFRVLRLLAEGGYSFVYLVAELPTPARPHTPPTQFALKKVLAATGEQLEAAKREIGIMRRLSHPNLLPLLASAVVPLQDAEASLKYHVYMLFPLYSGGSLWDEVTRRQQAGEALLVQEVLQISRQVCLGVAAMHRMSPPLAHRDIKPHNILLESHAARAAGAGAAAEPESQPLAPAGARRGMDRGSPQDPGGGMQAVLMDFGSTRPAHLEVSSRREALALQEDAEAHCTAPYRAPELFDVPSRCTLDARRCDVWSLGCVLFFMMAGESPFEGGAAGQGASLALAVANARYAWPPAAAERYPAGLRELAARCLTPDPAARPAAEDVLERVQELITRTGHI